MGEIADDLIDDFIFGSHGYPRIDKDAENDRRMKYCAKKITELGFVIDLQTKKEIRFQYKGETVSMFPFTGWHTGKTIKDGRGIENLLKQLI